MEFDNVRKPLSNNPAYRCPCCHFRTLHERGGNEICPVCFWEDDGQDVHDVGDVRGGPNGTLSLTRHNSTSGSGVLLIRRRAGTLPPTDAEH
ncbi:CPCC family cysteine-rich protein (plasmid) [Rhizobium leguminosarum]